jgi:hypothetical protein
MDAQALPWLTINRTGPPFRAFLAASRQKILGNGRRAICQHPADFGDIAGHSTFS